MEACTQLDHWKLENEVCGICWDRWMFAKTGNGHGSFVADPTCGSTIGGRGGWIGFDLKSHRLSQDGRLVGVRRGVNERNVNIAHEQMHIWPMKIEHGKTS